MVLRNKKQNIRKSKGSDKSHKIQSNKSKNISAKGYQWIILFLLLIFLDRLSKYWAMNMTKEVNMGFFSLVYATNTGAGFSVFQNSNTLLIWIAVIALGAMIYYHEYFPRSGFLLIITGLVGNLLDRIFYGYVIDFINFRFWPIFNLSDSMITIGAIITIIVWIRQESKKNSQKKRLKT